MGVAHCELCPTSRVGKVEPQRHPGRLCGLVNDCQQFGGEGIEVDLLAEDVAVTCVSARRLAGVPSKTTVPWSIT